MWLPLFGEASSLPRSLVPSETLDPFLIYARRQLLLNEFGTKIHRMAKVYLSVGVWHRANLGGRIRLSGFGLELQRMDRAEWSLWNTVGQIHVLF
jgi:hypothetical protein